MCVGPLAPKVPSLPAPPPPPPAPTPTPQRQDPSVVSARLKDRQIAARAQGRQANILTSGLGLTTPATSAKKKLLGA